MLLNFDLLLIKYIKKEINRKPLVFARQKDINTKDEYKHKQAYINCLFFFSAIKNLVLIYNIKKYILELEFFIKN